MSISDRLKLVFHDIETAAVSAGRNPKEINLIAVSKTHPVESIREAIAAGASTFGENKVQEGVSKTVELVDAPVEWHLIGHLQKNKARKAVSHFDVIQTVDSLKLAKRLDRIAGEERSDPLAVFAQVDLAGEKSKYGIPVEEMDEMTDFLVECKFLDFRGLMIIPPYFEDPEAVRPYFARLRELRDEMRDKGIFSADGGDLSMGMSHDFRVAIEEGATYIRVGTAIFGARQYSSE